MQQPRDFSIYGAVDLGARQAAAQRRQQAARAAETGASGSGEASAFVFDVTEETFNTDVAERSRTTPVIFFSPRFQSWDPEQRPRYAPVRG